MSRQQIQGTNLWLERSSEANKRHIRLFPHQKYHGAIAVVYDGAVSWGIGTEVSVGEARLMATALQQAATIAALTLQVLTQAGNAVVDDVGVTGDRRIEP